MRLPEDIQMQWQDAGYSRIQQVVEKAMKGAQKDFGFINDGDFWGTEEHFEAPQIRDRSEENTPLTNLNICLIRKLLPANR